MGKVVVHSRNREGVLCLSLCAGIMPLAARSVALIPPTQSLPPNPQGHVRPLRRAVGAGVQRHDRLAQEQRAGPRAALGSVLERAPALLQADAHGQQGTGWGRGWDGVVGVWDGVLTGSGYEGDVGGPKAGGFTAEPLLPPSHPAYPPYLPPSLSLPPSPCLAHRSSAAPSWRTRLCATACVW